MQPVQTQYMQNQMQNTNMTNDRIVCAQGVPQATYVCNLQSGTLNSNMSKLEPIEKEISFARYDIAALKRENSELRQKADGVETSCATISSLFDNYKTSCEKTETDVKTLQLEN